MAVLKKSDPSKLYTSPDARVQGSNRPALLTIIIWSMKIIVTGSIAISDTAADVFISGVTV